MECDFGNYNDYAYGSTYACYVENNLNTDVKERLVLSATGDHAEYMDDEVVNAIYIDDKNTKRFPTGIEKIFEFLAVIWIENGRLEQIKQDDLKAFPKLHSLYLGRNDISQLEDGLFDFNPQLTLISFVKSKLFVIGENVFDNLSKLNYLWLDGNVCINSTTYLDNSLEEVKKLIVEVKDKCSLNKNADE